MPYSEEDRIKRLAKVDPIIIAGGILLTFIAGFVNTVSLMYFHVPVSHMSGVVSKLGIDMAAGDYKDLANMLYIFAGFFTGSIVSGYIIGNRNLKAKKEYSLILFLEFLALFVSFGMFQRGLNLGLVIIAFACGMQNAMASSYLGLIIRTTHVTGIVTDLAALIGQCLKHRRIKLWKLWFLGSLLGGFFFGAFFALYAFNHLRFHALLIPSLLCLFCAVTFYHLRVRLADLAVSPG